MSGSLLGRTPQSIKPPFRKAHSALLLMNKIYLGPSDVKSVARDLGVSPRDLLRHAAKNWEVGALGANRARQLILDAANANGPGMASRGEYAFTLLGMLTAPSVTRWECNCGCGCKNHHAHPTSDYCGYCRSSCCGDDVFTDEDEDEDEDDEQQLCESGCGQIHTHPSGYCPLCRVDRQIW